MKRFRRKVRSRFGALVIAALVSAPFHFTGVMTARAAGVGLCEGHNACCVCAWDTGKICKDNPCAGTGYYGWCGGSQAACVVSGETTPKSCSGDWSEICPGQQQ